MAILLDTHVLIWSVLSPNRISATAQQAINNGKSSRDIIVADISLWEIAMVVEKKRVQTHMSSEGLIKAVLGIHKATVIPISAKIAVSAVQLPRSINKDPSDRLIVTTALVENAPLVTGDHNLITSTAIQTIW